MDQACSCNTSIDMLHILAFLFISCIHDEHEDRQNKQKEVYQANNFPEFVQISLICKHFFLSFLCVLTTKYLSVSVIIFYKVENGLNMFCCILIKDYNMESKQINGTLHNERAMLKVYEMLKDN